MADLPKIDVLLKQDQLSVGKVPSKVGNDWYTYDAILFRLAEDEQLVFKGRPEEYLIDSPDGIISDKKAFESEIVETIDVLYDRCEDHTAFVCFFLLIGDNTPYYETTQIELALEKPFLVAEQHFLRFRFDKRYQSYDLFLSTDDSETDIAFFKTGQKKDASMIHKVHNIKILFERTHLSGEYIISVKCQKPSMIAAYARLAKTAYRYASFSDYKEYGAFWKNNLDNDSIAELVSSAEEAHWVLARWYVPPRICRFLKRFFELKAVEEENSSLNKLYQCSDVISLVLGVLGLIGTKTGILTLVVGTIFNAMRPQEFFLSLSRAVDSVGGFKFNYDPESQINGTYQYGIRLEYVGESSGVFYNTVTNNYKIGQWLESEEMVSPDGEAGTWIDGREFVKEMTEVIMSLS